MDNTFFDDEKLYRAVFPPEIADMYWRRDGTISSAAFADSRGLSVDRGYYRSDEDVKKNMESRFIGRIVRFYVKNCSDIGAIVYYSPSKNNPYHSEIHGSNTSILLSKQQRHYLSKKAVMI